jgi:hypothetical protein
MRRVIISIALVWLTSMVISGVVIFLLDARQRTQIYFSQFGLTGVLVAVIQLSIYDSIKRHGHRTNDITNSHQVRQSLIERAVVTVVLYIILALIVCYIPLVIVSAIKSLSGKDYFLFSHVWMELLLYANALANPLIWLKTNKNVRKAVVETAMVFRARREPVESMEVRGFQDGQATFNPVLARHLEAQN